MYFIDMVFKKLQPCRQLLVPFCHNIKQKCVSISRTMNTQIFCHQFTTMQISKLLLLCRLFWARACNAVTASMIGMITSWLKATSFCHPPQFYIMCLCWLILPANKGKGYLKKESIEREQEHWFQCWWTGKKEIHWRYNKYLLDHSLLFWMEYNDTFGKCVKDVTWYDDLFYVNTPKSTHEQKGKQSDAIRRIFATLNNPASLLILSLLTTFFNPVDWCSHNDHSAAIIFVDGYSKLFKGSLQYICLKQLLSMKRVGINETDFWS